MGVENKGGSEKRGWNTQEKKSEEENAGLESAGAGYSGEITGVENARVVLAGGGRSGGKRTKSSYGKLNWLYDSLLSMFTNTVV